MRIGIVGAAGTGKSSLAKALGAHLGIPVVPDTVLAVLRERGRESWRGVDAGDRRKIREEALRRKTALEACEIAFVSDKTCVDYLAYWLQNQSEAEDRHINQTFLDQCKENATNFDVFVYLPYREAVEYAVGRNQDPIHNLKVAAHKRGLLAVLGLPHVEAPYVFGEDMAAWAQKWLQPFDKEP